MQVHGILMLFRINKNVKENIGIILILFALGSVSGILINLLGIVL